MKTLRVFAVLCLATSAAVALPSYDPFADATANGGTSYPVGTVIYGQTNAQGAGWFQAGPGTGSQVTIVADNLTVSGLASSSGNAVSIGGNGTSARFAFGSSISSGTAYYSMAIKLTDVSAVTTSGIFWAGFNNTGQSSQSTTPTTVVTRIVTKPAVGGFQIGLDRSSGQASEFVWDPTVYSVNDTLFLVGAYDFVAGSANDVSRLWINPSASTFGGAQPADQLVFGGTRADVLTAIQSFVLFDRQTTSPVGSTPVGIVDEVRVGTSWADVTPAIPEPGFLAFAMLGLIAGFRQARRAF